MDITKREAPALVDNYEVAILPASAILTVDQAGRLVYRDADAVRILRGHNVVTTAAKTYVATALGSASTAQFTHFAVGTGAVAEVAANTTLGAEVARSTLTKTSVGVGQIVFQFLLDASTGNGSTLAEAGVFSASSGGTMLNRWVHSPTVAKTSLIQILYSVTITVA
jgi:hypothetical protein